MVSRGVDVLPVHHPIIYVTFNIQNVSMKGKPGPPGPPGPPGGIKAFVSGSLVVRRQRH